MTYISTGISTMNQLYNSRIIDTYIKLINARYSHINVIELLNYANMKSYEVADQGHWFTQEQIDLFYERLVQLTGNDRIAREAGRFAASPEALGAMRQFILARVGPINAFKLINKISESLTRSSNYNSKVLSSNKIEINVVPHHGIQERPFQCENRMGFFEAFVVMFKGTLPEIQHTECMFNGGESCRYVLTWKQSVSAIINKIRNATGLVILLLVITAAWLDDMLFLSSAVAAGTITILLLSLLAQHYENNDLRVGLDNLRDSSEKLLDQIKTNYNNALITNDIGKSFSKQIKIDDILENAIQILEKHLDYERGMILLANAEKTRLIFRAGFGYTDEQVRLLDKVAFHLDRPESRGVFVLSFKQQKPFLINDFSSIEESLSFRSLALAKKLETKSFICCPIVYEEESLGVVYVDNLHSKRPLVQTDMSLLMGIAPIIGISIRNASLIDMKENQFKSLLEVLAASIDARDNLTAGHSLKVTEYAVGICGELNLSPEYTEMIRVAALLHDYGKIAVPDAILKKTGKLTAPEYEIVKRHSSVTKELLERINFEGILAQVPEVAGAHHEKLDGTGYPCGLKGKEIPLGARIIAVADFFEAITAKRHYREPMSLDMAFKLLQEEVGIHFEKRIVDAMMSYYNREYVQRAAIQITPAEAPGFLPLQEIIGV